MDRRGFIAGAIASTAALAVPTAVQPKPRITYIARDSYSGDILFRTNSPGDLMETLHRLATWSRTPPFVTVDHYRTGAEKRFCRTYFRCVEGKLDWLGRIT